MVPRLLVYLSVEVNCKEIEMLLLRDLKRVSCLIGEEGGDVVAISRALTSHPKSPAARHIPARRGGAFRPPMNTPTMESLSVIECAELLERRLA